jgi:hypothetical protein
VERRGVDRREGGAMTRLSVNINDETAAAIRNAMAREDRTATAVVKRAVSLYYYLREARKRGDEIQLVNGSTVTRVEFL